MNTNTYTHQFYATCPNNSRVIEYTLRITVPAERVVMVEHIVMAAALHKHGFHEAIADDLFRRFQGVQVLRGHHHGVDIETTRSDL